MTRPRWHDALLVLAIVVLGLAGAWALWWDDVRGALHRGTGEGSSAPAVPAASDRT